MVKLLKVKPARDGVHKFTAVFDDGKEVSFGAKGYSDMTQHGSETRKNRYLARHKPNETWNDPQTPGALSRWILWNKPSLRESIADFKRRFSL